MIDNIAQYANVEADRFAADLRENLLKIDDPAGLCDWLIRYDYFNRGFPGAALQLAGKIAFMDETFGDIGAEEVSAGIVAAIVDEFVSRKDMSTSLHSSLRREFVRRSCGNLAGKSMDAIFLDQLYRSYRQNVINSTREGYGLKAPGKDVGAIFSGLAFFMASETSGAHEFSVLKNVMREKWRNLMVMLSNAQDESGRILYKWVVEHEDLESDHARFALGAVECAFKNLTVKDAANKEDAVYTGIDRFFAMARRVLTESSPVPEAFQREWV